MRAVVGALCIVLFYTPVVLGKSLYVKGYNEVTVRASPSLKAEILAVLKTGQEVTMLGQEGTFYFVALPNGTKGYMVKAYLTEQVPADLRLRELEQKTQQRIKELEALTQAQEKELTALRQAQPSPQTQPPPHEKPTSLEPTKEQAEATANLQAELTQLRARQSDLERDNQVRWFLAGAGILFVGWILGRIGGRTGPRTRSSRLRL